MRTDLERFQQLYTKLGIELEVNTNLDGSQWVELAADDSFIDSEETTRSPKFEGFTGCYSQILFDSKGNFIKQGFWEE